MELSILIPARNEQFLKETIEDILKNIEADTNIIVCLDGIWPTNPLPQYERLNVIYVNKSIGQRKATNLAARLSNAKYVMKLDAHCSLDKGFDRKMIEFMKKWGDDVTAVPIMRNLWAFDWKCYTCGMKWYQGPTPTECKNSNYKDLGKPCEGKDFRRKMMWVGKSNPQSTAFCFDSEPHFQYFNEYPTREEYKKDREQGFTQTMSLQGSCFMTTREKYWELELCGEEIGNWGNQGIEVACKTWLSGGRVLVNHDTWYAHMFRTQGGDFGFPYSVHGGETEKTKQNVKDLFWKNQWPKQKYPISWLLEKFWPISGWSKEQLQELKKISLGTI